MAETVEIGKVSARGQIAIPAEIREKMHLKEGQKVLFLLDGKDLMMKKIEDLSWEEITRPLRQAAKRAGLKESDVPKWIQRVRRQ